MGDDEAALLRLWREKRGEVEPRTSRTTSSSSSGQRPRTSIGVGSNAIPIRSSQESSAGSSIRSCDGWRPRSTAMVEGTGAVFEAKFMLPWSFSKRRAAEKHMAQLQHNMWVDERHDLGAFDHHGRRQMGRDIHPGRPALPAPSSDGGEEILALRRERRAPSPVRRRATATANRGGAVVDMSASNSWAEFAPCSARPARLSSSMRRRKAELKALVPEDAKEAFGHGVRAKRSKSGAVSFELLDVEASHAAVQ